MIVAVITMTRDRLDYTHHCFATLRENAGCDFDHYVLDQASTDGTREWLEHEYDPDHLVLMPDNIGICRAANILVDAALEADDYDVIVRFDNDCEVTEPGTLQAVCELSAEYGAIIAPRVLGLNNPPPTLRTVSCGGQLVDETPLLGGIFMAIPAFAFTEYGFRFDERMALGTGDEAIVPWWRMQGGTCGYLHGWSVNHYETTNGQQVRYPEYFERKAAEAVI